jgi:hypothetical protein
MNISEKLRPGNTTFVNAVIIGLLLHVLSAHTAGAVIGKKSAWKGMNFLKIGSDPPRNNG